MQIRWRRLREGKTILAHKALLFITCCFFIIILYSGTTVYGEMEPLIEGASRSDALIDLLLDKGILTREEADKLLFTTPLEEDNDTRAVRKQQNFELLLMLLSEKKILSDEEMRHILDAPDKSVPAGKETENFLGEDVQNQLKAYDVKVKEELQQTKQRIDENVDLLLQRDRLTEQRLEELERQVTEEHAEKLYKSSWAQRIDIGGDLRLRYQQDFKDPGNAPRPGDSGPEPTNIDREQYRYRFRLNAKAKLIDPREINVGKVDAGFRLSTGNDLNPVSTNETLGDYQNKDTLVLDRAYLKWRFQPIDPKWGNKFPLIEISGGRMPNPFQYTDLVWDDDLNFEGLTAHFVTDTEIANSWRVFATAGAYPMEEVEFQTADKWLYSGQVGYEHRPFYGLNYKLALAYYDYVNVKGQPNITQAQFNAVDSDWSATGFIQGGNTLFDINQRFAGDPAYSALPGLASDFNLLNVTAIVNYDRFFPTQVILRGDYVSNLGYDREEVLRLNPSVPHDALDQTEGYQVGVTVGYPEPRAFGDWNFSFFFKHLEADAVLDAFTDSDFHLGGTDAEGWILNGQYAIYQNIWLNAKWITANEIIESNGQWAVDTFQLDVNAVF